MGFFMNRVISKIKSQTINSGIIISIIISQPMGGSFIMR